MFVAAVFQTSIFQIFSYLPKWKLLIFLFFLNHFNSWKNSSIPGFESTCLHILPDFTESEYPLWFRIALRSSVFMVKSVKLNYLSSSSNIFNIFVWEMWWQEYEPQHLCYSGNLLNNTELTCSSPMIGKYVTVASNSSNTAVYICEIEVYGIGMWKTFENYKQIQIQALQAYFW